MVLAQKEAAGRWYSRYAATWWLATDSRHSVRSAAGVSAHILRPTLVRRALAGGVAVAVAVADGGQCRQIQGLKRWWRRRCGRVCGKQRLMQVHWRDKVGFCCALAGRGEPGGSATCCLSVFVGQRQRSAVAISSNEETCDGSVGGWPGAGAHQKRSRAARDGAKAS